jgi:hypothetical protein
VTNFPSLENVKSSIDKLRQYKFPKFKENDSPDDFTRQISKIITDEFSIFPNLPKIEKVNEFGFKFFRVRELSSFTNKNIVSEHSYSPVNLTKVINRCNFPKYPVFYCSTHPMIALCEVVKNDDFTKRKYIISRWSNHSTDQKMLLEPFVFGDLPDESIFNILKKGILNRLPEIFENKLTTDQEEGMKLYLEFLSNSFIKDNDYSLSASLAHRRLYAQTTPNGIKTDIVLYPSVQTKYHGINMAVHPNFVDRLLFPDRFYEVEVNDLDKEVGKINVSFTRYGHFDRCQINWVDLRPDDTLYRDFIKEDFEFKDEFIFIKTT